MLWSKVGGSILREVDDSRLLRFVRSQADKVVGGDCRYLETKAKTSMDDTLTSKVVVGSENLPGRDLRTGPLRTG